MIKTVAVIAIILGLVVISGLIYSRILITTSGLDPIQINSYSQAVDGANKIKRQVEDPSRYPTITPFSP